MWFEQSVGLAQLCCSQLNINCNLFSRCLSSSVVIKHCCLLLCAKTVQQSVVENLEEIVIGVLLALFDTDELHSDYADFITYVIDLSLFDKSKYCLSGQKHEFWSIFGSKICLSCIYRFCIYNKLGLLANL